MAVRATKKKEFGENKVLWKEICLTAVLMTLARSSTATRSTERLFETSGG